MLPSSTRNAILREHRVGFKAHAIAQHFGVSIQQVVEVVHGLDRDPIKPSRKPGRPRKAKAGEVPPLEELTCMALMARSLVMAGEPLNVIYGNFADCVTMDWLDAWAKEKEANDTKQGKKK